MKTIVVSFSAEFRELAFNEIRRNLGQFTSSPIASGVFCVHFKQALRPLLTAWKKSPPVYVHHIFPVHTRVSVKATAQDLLKQLRRTLRKTTLLRRLDKKLSFCVQARAVDCCPSVGAEVVASALEKLARQVTKCQLDVRSPQQVISVLITGNGCWLGLSPIEENVSPWPGGGPPIAADRERLNRAEYKLIEALRVFKISLKRGGRTLDLGAGPGGWTRVLLANGQKVTAVSPRVLVDPLLNNDKVDYFRQMAEEFIENALATPRAHFDFITNDMYLVPQESARLMVQAAPLLPPGGQAIVTLKLRCNDWRRIMSHALRILKTAYFIPRMKHLFFNHKEITLWLKKREKS